VVIPVGAPLKTVLDRAAKRSTIILTTIDGKPWTPDGFRASWRKACARAGIAGLTFNDLRGTAVTRLALANARKWRLRRSPDTVCVMCAILDAHYLHRDPALAESAIRKLEKRTESPK